MNAERCLLAGEALGIYSLIENELYTNQFFFELRTGLRGSSPCYAICL